MAWVRLDDEFDEHPKIARVGPFGAWLQVQALCYCNRNLTDGFVPLAIAEAFMRRGIVRLDDAGRRWTLGETCGMQGRDVHEADWAAVLVEAGMWEVVPGGYRIHDYKHYQPSKAEVLAERQRWAAKKQRQRKRRNVPGGTLPGSPGPPVPVPVPVPGSVPRSVPEPKETLALASLACASTTEFDEFWKAYPRHVDKQKARKAWAKLRPPPLKAILDALTWQRELPDWRKENGDFVPYAATYLNGRRWEDEPPRAQLFGVTARTAGNAEAIKKGLGLA